MCEFYVVCMTFPVMNTVSESMHLKLQFSLLNWIEYPGLHSVQLNYAVMPEHITGQAMNERYLQETMIFEYRLPVEIFFYDAAPYHNHYKSI